MYRRVFGTKHGAPTSVGPFKDVADPKSYLHTSASRSSLATYREAEGAPVTNDSETPEPLVQVIAKISTHTLREERTFHICSNLFHSVDPQGNHIVRPVDLLRLAPQQGDKGPFVVSIFEAPGRNSLLKYIQFSPAGQNLQTACELIPLPVFLDFAIGATECLEILHHGQRIVHGEIRGDAFHFDETTGQTRLINFGSGLRSFEHGLTSHGWSTLSKEAGAKTKLSFISPEQTGRMPAEPDSRTDIYSLGILFWTLLTQKPAFDGPTPMDIIQSVLGRRLPSVSTVRLEVPDILGRIIAKMTAKDISERYHSASGLRHDLAEVQKLLGNGDSVALGNLTLATKDVSSFFILPSIMIGREEERDEIVKIIDKVSKGHTTSHKQSPNVLSSRSSISDGRPESLDIADDISEHTSSAGSKSNGTAISGQNAHRLHHALSSASRASSQSHATKDSAHGETQPKPWGKNTSAQFDSQSTTGGMSTSSDTQRSTSEGAGSISQKNVHKFSRKGRCEVISIAGAGGLGKSRLVHSVQVEARRRGYFASSKFDSAQRTPFGPLLKLLSSLFKQVFSESDTDTPFHQILKHYVRPVWPILHKVLGLPEFLLGSDNGPNRRPSQLQPTYNKSIRADQSRRDSTSSRVSLYSISLASQSSQEFLRAGSATKSARLMNTFLDVLRVFAQYKFLCFCLDDLQFADDESLELISQLISSKMKVVLIVTYRPEEMLPEQIKSILEPPGTDGLRKHIPYHPQQTIILLTHTREH